MGDALKQLFLGTGDKDLSPKLRPPSLLGVLFSLISAFCFIVCMVSFQLGPVTLILCLAVVVLYGALGTGEGSAWERGYPSTTFLVPIGAGTALLPLYIGIKIYVVIYAPYYLAVSGRSYSDVSPVSKSAIYADAGIIGFTDDATLDTQRSFGYKADDFTYCVAPVVSRTDAVHPQSSGRKVTFWAVGRDCCGNRREFECDGAGEVEVKSAFAQKDLDLDSFTKLLVPSTSRPRYLQAIAAAKALHNLRSEEDENIILVRWADKPEETLQVWHDRAKLAVALSCVAYSIIIVIVWTSIHIYHDRDMHFLANSRDPNYRGSATSKGVPRQVRDPFMIGSGAA